MYLTRNNFLSKNASQKYFPDYGPKKFTSTFSYFPFSTIKITKNKFKIKEKVLKFKENEEHCLSLIDLGILYDIRQKEKKYKNYKLNESSFKSNKNISNNKGKNNIESLINKKDEKKSCYTVNSVDLKSRNYFPLINRIKRKTNTINLLKNNIKNNLKLNEMTFENKNDQKFQARSSLIYKDKFKYSSYNNENKKNVLSSFKSISSSIIDKSDYDQTNSKLLLTELINSNKSSKSNISNINFDYNNNYFSFKSNKNGQYSNKRRIINLKRNFKKSKSYFSSANIMYPKNLISNKLMQKDIPNRTLSSFKSPIILKNNLNIRNEPFINKNKTNLFLTSNKEVISPNEDSNDSSSISKSKASSKANILKLSTSTNELSKKFKMENSHSLKKRKKKFRAIIKNKIEDLEKEYKKDMEKNNYNSMINKMVIKYMIKKCKKTLNVADEKVNHEIYTMMSRFKTDELYKNLGGDLPDIFSLIIKIRNQILINEKNKKNKKVNPHDIIKNLDIIYSLIEKNNYLRKKIDKFIGLSLENKNN